MNKISKLNFTTHQLGGIYVMDLIKVFMTNFSKIEKNKYILSRSLNILKKPIEVNSFITNYNSTNVNKYCKNFINTNFDKLITQNMGFIKTTFDKKLVLIPRMISRKKLIKFIKNKIYINLHNLETGEKLLWKLKN